MTSKDLAMGNPEDIICAISTPPGIGGIAVCRVSGPGAIELVDKVWKGKSLKEARSHTAHLGDIVDLSGQVLDQCVATVFRAPRTFTGQDTVEISVHGSDYVQQNLLVLLCQIGARMAQPGEYTRRAYINGRIGLTEAEAVADLIAARTKAAHKVAVSQMRGSVSTRLEELRQQMLELVSLLELELDFSEEDVEFASREKLIELATATKDEVDRLMRSFKNGNAIRNGIPVAIVGATNAGKSSLLNQLVEDDRAIVSDIHGTTRDTVEELCTIGGHLVRIIDTAGIRNTDDAIENMGIERTKRSISQASIILHLIDGTEDIQKALDEFNSLERDPEAHVITLINKSDKLPHQVEGYLNISAKTGQGLDKLKEEISDIGSRLTQTDQVMITNLRHRQALEDTSRALEAVIEGLKMDIPGDLVAQDLREALFHLGTITRAISTPEVLNSIFSKHCIGK